jgi:hypothetical protein
VVYRRSSNDKFLDKNFRRSFDTASATSGRSDAPTFEARQGKIGQDLSLRLQLR